MDLYEALRESHQTQRALCTRLLRTRPGTAARIAVFRELFVELEAHAAAEERFLYAPMLMDDAGLSSARHALSEHHEIEELLEELAVPDKSVDGWMATAKALSHKVRHHLKEEERGFFQVSGKILTDRQKAALAKRYVRDLARMKRKLQAA